MHKITCEKPPDLTVEEIPKRQVTEPVTIADTLN
jgi:hypothetical protein